MTPYREKTPGLIETMTIEEVRDFRPEIVLLPLGSTEPHGPHLPYGTDTIVVDSLTAEATRLANESQARVLRLPALPIGNNVNFKAFPFACRIGVETLMAILLDLATFTRDEGVRKLVIMNGHGGNDASVKASLRQIHDRLGRELFAYSCSPWTFAVDSYKSYYNDGSPHAGQYETSSILHFAPDLVVSPALAPAEMHQPVLSCLRQGGEWIKPWHRLMPSSCGGRPDLASAEYGREFSDACIKGFAAFLVELSREPWHPAFPYAREPL